MSKPNVLVLAFLIFTSNISIAASNSSQNNFIDTLLICKNNLNQLDLLPTILSQTGWVEVSQDNNYPVFQHLFKKGVYEIGLRHNLAKDNVCVVRLMNLTQLPEYELKDIFTNFPPSSNDKQSFCRNYTYASKNIEWEYGDKNFIRYFIDFNEKKTLFSLGAQIQHSDSGKYFSLCNAGYL